MRLQVGGIMEWKVGREGEGARTHEQKWQILVIRMIYAAAICNFIVVTMSQIVANATMAETDYNGANNISDS